MTIQNLKRAYESYKAIRGDDKSTTFLLLCEIVDHLMEKARFQSPYPYLPIESRPDETMEPNPFICPTAEAERYMTPIDFRLKCDSAISEVYIRKRLQTDSRFLDFCGVKRGCHYLVQPKRALWWLWNNSDNRIRAKLKRYSDSLIKGKITLQ